MGSESFDSEPWFLSILGFFQNPMEHSSHISLQPSLMGEKVEILHGYMPLLIKY